MDEESFINLLGVDYKREGHLFKICCPFHHDTHPSLVVYPQDRGYCCYPCGRTGSWQELYKEIKGCEWKEAYDVLDIQGDYHSETKPRIRFDFVESDSSEFVAAVQEKYGRCLSLDSPEAKPGVEFLQKKHILETAKKLGWRWDTGNFVQSKPSGALVIPYFEEGEVVACRLRVLEDGQISKPKTLRGTKARPYVIVREGADDLYICEGESDALSLYASGCSVVAVPGARQVRCINTAVLYAELTNAKRIISCGDNDGPGKEMNRLVQKAAHALTACRFEVLTEEATSGMNDINDAYVAGKLNLQQQELRSIFAGASEVTGWEGVFAKSLFSEKEEIYDYLTEELEKYEDAPEDKMDFLVNLFSANSMEELRKVWVSGKIEHQRELVYLKETMKLVLAPKPPARQTSLFDVQNRS